MRTLDLYIARTVVGTTLLTLAVLLSMFVFFGFMEELDEVGKGDYRVLDAALHMLLTTPRRALDLFPVAAILGSLLGLGVLASHSELTVMRAAGLSVRRISLGVMKGAAVLMVLVILLGEFISPPVEQYAQERRSTLQTEHIVMKTRESFWARDGNSYINIRTILPGNHLAHIYIYEFDDDHQLKVATHAERASFEEERWLLQDIRQSRFSPTGVETLTAPWAEWQSLLAPDLLNVVVVEPDRLSSLGLLRYAAFLRQNNQDTSGLELAFWTNVMSPITTGVMIFLAIPFVFGPLRSVGVGARVLAGSLVGIGFFIVNQAFGQGGLVYGFSPLLSAALPTFLLLGGGLWWTRRVL